MLPLFSGNIKAGFKLELLMDGSLLGMPHWKESLLQVLTNLNRTEELIIRSFLKNYGKLQAISGQEGKNHEAHPPHAADRNLHSRLAGVDPGRRVPDWYGEVAGNHGHRLCSMVLKILSGLPMGGPEA